MVEENKKTADEKTADEKKKWFMKNANNSDFSYIVDDNNQVVGKQVFRPDGVVDVYYSNDNFQTHSHDRYSSVDAFIDATDRAFNRQGSSRGDLSHRDASINPRKHHWLDLDGVLER